MGYVRILNLDLRLMSIPVDIPGTSIKFSTGTRVPGYFFFFFSTLGRLVSTCS
eukprot:SAG11_NODE_19437_length_466_cov_1.531335_1_plen_52_part_01